MSSCVEEIREYLERAPRLNVVLIKAVAEIQEKQIVEEFDCDVINVKKLISEESLNIEGIDGYTSLLNFVNNTAEKTPKNIILILHLDILLTMLDRQKRQYFFEAILQKTFRKPVIITTYLYSDEVPDTSGQEFNYAKTIQWRQ